MGATTRPALQDVVFLTVNVQLNLLFNARKAPPPQPVFASCESQKNDRK